MRVAPAMRRNDWTTSAVDYTPVDAVTRRELARAWLDDALLEHASIASFARFTLELLGLGAPRDLVADAQKAAADEVEHARLCFTLASQYADEALGPGPLDIGGRLLRSDLVEIAISAVREGCIGETLAAVQAGAQFEGARDARVRAALGTIAADETRHAELAWRFVRWAMEIGGEAVRAAVAREFCDALAELRTNGDARLEAAPPPIDAMAWRTHGRLSSEDHHRVRREALRDVIEPCSRALLQGPGRGAAPSPESPRPIPAATA